MGLNALRRRRTHQNLPFPGLRCDAGSQVGNRSGSRKCLAALRARTHLGGAYQCRPAVDPHVKRERWQATDPTWVDIINPYWLSSLWKRGIAAQVVCPSAFYGSRWRAERRLARGLPESQSLDLEKSFLSFHFIKTLDYPDRPLKGIWEF